MTLHADAWIRVLADERAIRAGDLVAVVLAHAGVTRELVIGRDGDRLFATQRRCPHQAGDLADGIVARGHLVCPVHTWRFSTTTGALDVSPVTCLRVHAVRVVDGAVEVWSRPTLPGEALG